MTKPWRPYVDDPLFTAEIMFGYDALPAVQAQRLTDYLQSLASHRGVLHTAVAFNAVYFGYDLNFCGYSGGPVDFDLFPVAALGIPVGAMVNLAAAEAALYGEVLYKEGAHGALLPDGAVPAWLSGAPAGTQGPDGTEPAERIVLDFDAFGQGVTTTRERLDRLRRRERILDDLGHAVLPVADLPPRTADDEFVAYLLGPARASLVRGPLPLMLSTDADDRDLEAAVRAALRTLDQTLSQAPDLRRWGHYAFPRESLRRRLTDDGSLGGEDLRSLVGGVILPPTSRRHRPVTDTVTYTAVGSRLRSLAHVSASFSGVAYAEAVCHANVVLADTARRDADERGLLENGGHLRLDDAEQGGGIWRTSFPGGSYADLDPLLPLGLGWLSCLPSVPEETEEEPPSTVEGLTVTDSQISWTVPLRSWHIRQRALPLPATLVRELSWSELRLRLYHDGGALPPEEADQMVRLDEHADGLRLTGVSWPLDYFPGIVLTFWWPRGAPTLNATSTLLACPETVNGELLEHRYDPGIVTRDTAPGCRPRGPARPLTLDERVLRAVRRAGLVCADGTAVLPEAMLCRAVLGVDHPQRGVLSPVVERLITIRMLSREHADRTSDGRLIFPPSATGTEPVLVWRPEVTTSAPETGEPDVFTGRLRAHQVRWFLRRLRLGQQASETARAEYRLISSSFKIGGELPDGYTLVREHQRGQRE